MKRYLIIGYYGENYQTDAIQKQDLVRVKERVTDFVIDTQNGTVFDPDTNSWKEIEKR